MRSTDERRPSAPTQSGAAVQCAHCIIDSLDRGGVDFIGAFAHGRDTGPIADLGQKLTHATSLKSCPNIALSSYLESHVGRRRCLFSADATRTTTATTPTSAFFTMLIYTSKKSAAECVLLLRVLPLLSDVIVLTPTITASHSL